jgi:hypothetical protein
MYNFAFDETRLSEKFRPGEENEPDYAADPAVTGAGLENSLFTRSDI